MLYRLCYLREGKMRGVTFFAGDLVAALEIEQMWERLAKVKVLTIKPVGSSRFVARGKRTVLRESAQDLGN